MFKYMVGLIMVILGKSMIGNSIFLSETVIDILSVIADISMIIVTCYIAYRTEKNTKRQDKKILYDNKINRIANFQSILCFDKSIEMYIMNDSLMNLEVISQHANVLLSENRIENKIENYYGIQLVYYLKNLTNIYPKSAFIKDIQIWDNTNDTRQQKENLQVSFSFMNINNKYKNVTVDKDKNTCIEVYCCMIKEELDKLYLYNKSNTFFNIIMNLEIKNVCGIISNCEIRGTFNIKNKMDLSSGACGGNKLKVELENKESYLKIIDIREEKKDE